MTELEAAKNVGTISPSLKTLAELVSEVCIKANVL